MDDERRSRRAHRRTMTAVLGSTAVIAVGCSMLIAPAANASTLSDLLCTGSTTGSSAGSTTGTTGTTVSSVVSGATSAITTTTGTLTVILTGTSTPTSIIDTTGAGTGLINTGSTSGLVGISTSSNGLSVGLLDGTATVSTGASSAGGPTTAVTAGGSPATTVETDGAGTPAPTRSTTPTSSTPTPSTTSTGTTTTTSGVVVAGAGIGSTALATVRLSRSAAKVYPAEDGYLDSVRFGVSGLSADGHAVAVVGTAVLKRAGATVRIWQLDGATTALTWNGRVGSAVRTGSYTLTVTGVTADGSRTATTAVRVYSQHLATRTITAKSSVRTTSSATAMPKAVKKAIALAPVTVKLRTVAKVHGRAKLVLTGTTLRRSVPLRSGTHTTSAMTVTTSSKAVTVEHSWKKGTRLVSMKAIWTYKVLVA